MKNQKYSFPQNKIKSNFSVKQYQKKQNIYQIENDQNLETQSCYQTTEQPSDQLKAQKQQTLYQKNELQPDQQNDLYPTKQKNIISYENNFTQTNKEDKGPYQISKIFQKIDQDIQKTNNKTIVSNHQTRISLPKLKNKDSPFFNNHKLLTCKNEKQEQKTQIDISQSQKWKLDFINQKQQEIKNYDFVLSQQDQLEFLQSQDKQQLIYTNKYQYQAFQQPYQQLNVKQQTIVEIKNDLKLNSINSNYLSNYQLNLQNCQQIVEIFHNKMAEQTMQQYNQQLKYQISIKQAIQSYKYQDQKILDLLNYQDFNQSNNKQKAISKTLETEHTNQYEQSINNDCIDANTQLNQDKMYIKQKDQKNMNLQKQKSENNFQFLTIKKQSKKIIKNKTNLIEQLPVLEQNNHQKNIFQCNNNQNNDSFNNEEQLKLKRDNFNLPPLENNKYLEKDQNQQKENSINTPTFRKNEEEEQTKDKNYNKFQNFKNKNNQKKLQSSSIQQKRNLQPIQQQLSKHKLRPQKNQNAFQLPQLKTPQNKKQLEDLQVNNEKSIKAKFFNQQNQQLKQQQDTLNPSFCYPDQPNSEEITSALSNKYQEQKFHQNQQSHIKQNQKIFLSKSFQPIPKIQNQEIQKSQSQNKNFKDPIQGINQTQQNDQNQPKNVLHQSQIQFNKNRFQKNRKLVPSTSIQQDMNNLKNQQKINIDQKQNLNKINQLKCPLKQDKNFQRQNNFKSSMDQIQSNNLNCTKQNIKPQSIEKNQQFNINLNQNNQVNVQDQTQLYKNISDLQVQNQEKPVQLNENKTKEDDDNIKIQKNEKSISNNKHEINKDTNFPPTKRSVSFSVKDNKNFEQFQIVYKIFPNREISLFKNNSTSVNDVVQGHINDCYFLQALTLLAQYPGYVKSLFQHKNLQKIKNQYKIQMIVNGVRQKITVDIFLPCDQNNKLCYAQSNGENLWVCFLEKAFAKINECYENIDYGYSSYAMNLLTGSPSQRFIHSDQTEKEQQLFDKKYIWDLLTKSLEQKYLLYTATESNKSIEKMGLVPNHAYSILDAKSIKIQQRIENIIKLRNPWGKSGWKGDWSYSSKKWFKELKEEVNLEEKDEGIFWIGLDDYFNNFIFTEVSYFNPTYNYSFLEIENDKPSTNFIYNFKDDQNDIKGYFLLHQIYYPKQKKNQIMYYYTSPISFFIFETDSQFKNPKNLISYKGSNDRSIYSEINFEKTKNYTIFISIDIQNDQKKNITLSFYTDKAVSLSKNNLIRDQSLEILYKGIELINDSSFTKIADNIFRLEQQFGIFVIFCFRNKRKGSILQGDLIYPNELILLGDSFQFFKDCRYQNIQGKLKLFVPNNLYLIFQQKNFDQKKQYQFTINPTIKMRQTDRQLYKLAIKTQPIITIENTIRVHTIEHDFGYYVLINNQHICQVDLTIEINSENLHFENEDRFKLIKNNKYQVQVDKKKFTQLKFNRIHLGNDMSFKIQIKEYKFKYT